MEWLIQEEARAATKSARTEARGKFIHLGGRKLYLRGVTYGTFRPDAAGDEFPSREEVSCDFAMMSAHHINAVRTYTPPPRWLLDLAQEHGLSVFVGLAMERYAGYLTDSKGAPNLEDLLRKNVARCAGHPAVLCYAIANEIPAATVRWLGAERTERFLERMNVAAKQEDPQGLVTYVNYPSTEYLRLPFLDLVAFNVYLESESTLAGYLARLQNLAGERPLLMSEIGLDSRRNGEWRQAEVLDWQVRTTFSAGCAGAFVYAWTDQWYRGGEEVSDWDFGLTRRNREPKPALGNVARAYTRVPFAKEAAWPRISVVVCTHNGSRTIAECLKGIQQLDYPEYEVLVINDGSTDNTSEIVGQFPVRLITTENCGLSHARNLGWRKATGEIVAYIDDDAYPDADWLTYLAHSFRTSSHAGVGGPNIVPPEAPFWEDSVAHAPGGPTHVLLTDQEAEHIPGCNMAFRRQCLEAIGGFDPQFRVAGDDVDFCWRIQAQGWSIGFNAAAVVWHHRRRSLSAYWKQQAGYGRAEALLEAKWPEKYNSAGHATFTGRIYDRGLINLLFHAGRIYHGIWGSAPFQSLYERTPGPLLSLVMMPEWFLVLGFLALVSALGLCWQPFWVALPLLGIGSGLSLLQAIICTKHTAVAPAGRPAWSRWRRRGAIIMLRLVQPLARLKGRLHYGLTFWKTRGQGGFALPFPQSLAVFARHGQPSESRLEALRQKLRLNRELVVCGGEYERWDLEVISGVFGSARLLMAVEEQGGGSQYVRFRITPRVRLVGRLFLGGFGVLALLPALEHAWAPAVLFATLTGVTLGGVVQQCGAATAALLRVLDGAEVQQMLPFIALPEWAAALIQRARGALLRSKGGVRSDQHSQP